jgi:hypothetical protein
MAFKSFPVAIGSTDTDVFECPAATEAAVVLLVSNVSSSARTYTLKFYKASLDVTRTLLSSVSVAANTAAKVPAPISMEAGDKIIMSCSNANDIVVGGTITLSGTVQVISTFVSEGEWDSETTYTENVSIVSRSGNSYLARPNAEPNVDQDPATATDFWTLLAEKGETGDGDLSAANNLNDLADKPTAFANIKQAATTEASGVVELADVTETDAHSDTGRAVTPAGLVNHLKTNAESQGPITGGASVTPKDLGNSGTSTIAVDVRDRATQLLSNTGNFTLEMAAHAGSTVLYITNSETAGSVTTSYFTYVKGDAFTTTNGHIFRCTLEYVSSALKILWVERL